MPAMGNEQEQRPASQMPARDPDVAALPAPRGKPSGSSTSAALPVQRRPGTGGDPAATLGRAAATSRVRAIEGPLRPGERQVSGDIEVEQLSAERAVIRRGDDVITIEGSRHRNEGYAFHIEAASAEAGQRVVRIAATVDVAIHEEHGEGDGWTGYERMLVPHLVHVQDPALVPAQGTVIDPKRYLRAQRIGGISHRSERHSLLAMTGTDGVTVRESVTGAAVRIAARDSKVGHASRTRSSRRTRSARSTARPRSACSRGRAWT